MLATKITAFEKRACNLSLSISLLIFSYLFLVSVIYSVIINPSFLMISSVMLIFSFGYMLSKVVGKKAIVLPLFFFIGKVLTDKNEFANRMRTGLLISVSAYAILSIIIIAFAKPLLSLMATDKAIIDASATYIRIESVASIFSLAFNFIMVAMVTLGKEKYVYMLTVIKLVLCLLVDTFMVSTLPISLNLGVDGIAFSNIIVNVILVATAIILLHKEGIVLFKKAKLSFAWMKDFLKVGGISGIESLVRNVAYM